MDDLSQTHSHRKQIDVSQAVVMFGKFFEFGKIEMQSGKKDYLFA